MLRVRSRFHGALEFVCERWCLASNVPPILRKKQSISTDETSTNWLLYVKYSGNEANMRAGRANPISFSSDCQLLRIGSQIFVEDVKGDYISLLGPTTVSDHYFPYIEEFTGRGRFTVLASRRVVTKDDIYESGIRDTKVADFGTDFTKMEEDLSMTLPAAAVELGSNDGDDADSESSYGSSTDSSSHAYETWSECSTDEADVQFEDDLITPWTGRVASLDKSSSEFSDTPVSEDGEKSEAEANSESSKSESDLSPSAVINYGRYYADTSSDDDWNVNPMPYDQDDSDDNGYATFAYNLYRQKKPSIEPHASIAVFDTTSPIPTKIFDFTRTLPFLLYGSPPVIHPSESLIVWPLSRGDVLFANFLARTFFVRKLRPSTAHSKFCFTCQTKMLIFTRDN